MNIKKGISYIIKRICDFKWINYTSWNDFKSHHAYRNGKWAAFNSKRTWDINNLNRVSLFLVKLNHVYLCAFGKFDSYKSYIIRLGPFLLSEHYKDITSAQVSYSLGLPQIARKPRLGSNLKPLFSRRHNNKWIPFFHI